MTQTVLQLLLIIAILMLVVWYNDRKQLKERQEKLEKEFANDIKPYKDINLY